MHLKLLKLAMPADDDTPDQALVTRAKGDDVEALGVLVRRHQRAVFLLCLRYVQDPDEAADLVQRSFERAMAKLGDLRDPALFRAWILRIGAHLSLNHIRDHARFVSDEGDREGASDLDRLPTPSSLDQLESAERAAALREAVRTLPTKQRMTLELRIYEDLPFREIAEALSISEGAAKVNFHYAVRKLRAHLGPQPDGASRRGRGH